MEKKVTKKDTKLQIGRFIKARMLDKGLNIEDLAKKACVKEPAVRRWFRGETSPDLDTLLLVAKALDTTVDEILNAECQPIENTAESRLAGRITSLGGRTGAVMCTMMGAVMAFEVLFCLCTIGMLFGTSVTQLSGFAVWAIVAALWALGGVYLMISGLKSLNEFE